MRIVQYWDSGELPGYVDDLTRTFRERNPEVEHRVFDERAATRFIASNFSEREVAAFAACGVPSMRADYFRYCAVLVTGGVYVDVGFRCIAPLRPLVADVDGGVLFRQDPPGFVINGIFGFATPDHPLLRLALDVATDNIEQRRSEMVQMVTGPWIFSALFLLHRLTSLDAHRDGVVERGLGCLEAPLRSEAMARAPTAAGRRGVEPMVRPLLGLVGDLARLEQAFEGVCVAPYSRAAGWVREPEESLPYKRDASYWINWQARGLSIFKSS